MAPDGSAVEPERGQAVFPEPGAPATPIALDRGDVGMRVDLVLLRHLRHQPGVSRNRLQRLVDLGAVQINGAAVARASRRITAGDVLTVALPPRRPQSAPVAEALPLTILYEDHDLLIADKPAGQVCHPAARHARGTLFNALLAHAAGAWRPALSTRLDKDTSGLVLVAKATAIQRTLQRMALDAAIDKDYLAVVRGRPPARGTIDLGVQRDPWNPRRVRAVDRGGAPSITRFVRLDSLRVSPREGWSLLRCRLITGRTHQIRVHLAAMGWPIIGDAVYGVASPHIQRQALHACSLSFRHPRCDRRIEARSPLPPDMTALLETGEIGEDRSQS